MNSKLVFWTLMMECPAEWMYFRHGYAFGLAVGRLWAYER